MTVRSAVVSVAAASAIVILNGCCSKSDRSRVLIDQAVAVLNPYEPIDIPPGGMADGVTSLAEGLRDMAAKLNDPNTSDPLRGAINAYIPEMCRRLESRMAGLKEREIEFERRRQTAVLLLKEINDPTFGGK